MEGQGLLACCRPDSAPGQLWGGKGLPGLAARTVTRRHVLAAVAGAGGLAAFGLLPSLGSLVGRSLSAAELTQVRFAALLGTTFKVRLTQAHAASIRLAEVRPIKPVGVPVVSGEGFSLHFTGSGSRRFGQDTYEVAHPTLGKFSVFLVPVGPTAADQQYEAVFNRLWK